MRQMMYFGGVCSGCKRPVTLGKIDIEPTAPPSMLHDELQRLGWKSDTVTCEREECKATTFVTLEMTILLGQA